MEVIQVIYYIVVSLVSITKLVDWLKANDISKFLTVRGPGIARVTYLFVAIVVTLYLLAMIILFSITIPFSISLATLFALFMLGLLGVWSPEIQRLHNERLNTTANAAMIVLITLALAGFWVVQWPVWQTPALLTALWILTFVFYLVDKYILKRKRRTGRVA